jgi:hypothetical protein
VTERGFFGRRPVAPEAADPSPSSPPFHLFCLQRKLLFPGLPCTPPHGPGFSPHLDHIPPFLKEHEVYDFTAADFEQDRETLRQFRVREAQH